jgi:predicted secreted protein
MKYNRFVFSAFFLFTCYHSYCQYEKQEDNLLNTNIKISLNEQFDISLENCADGGYFWYIAAFDTTKIILIDSSRITKYPNRVGSPQIQNWTFMGIQKGEYQIGFNYKRAWLDAIERKEYYTILIE